MQGFLSLLITTALLVSTLAAPLALAADEINTGSLGAPAGANYWADAVIVDRGSNSGTDDYDETTHAQTSGDDVELPYATDNALYVGMSNDGFDGMSLTFSTSSSSSTNGKYIVEYYSTSGTWETLLSETSTDLDEDTDADGDGSDDILLLEWERPSNSDWDDTSIDYEYDQSETSTTANTGDHYWVRLRLTEDYDFDLAIDEIGVLNYNLIIEAEDELGNAISADMLQFSEINGNDPVVYTYTNNGDGTHSLALNAGNSADYTYRVAFPGFVNSDETDVTVTDTQTSSSVSLDYAYKLTAYDTDGSTEVAIDSAFAGDNDTTCVIDSNYAYCAVPYDEDNGSMATLYVDGYAPGEEELSDRGDITINQQEMSFTLEYAYIATVQNGDGVDITGATVSMGDSSYSISCEELGSGEYGCITPVTNSSAAIKIEADGYETLESNFSSPRTASSDSQQTETFALSTDDSNSSGDTDDEDEDDEDSDSEDEPDLTVNSVYLDDYGDINFQVTNNGGDVEEDTDVYIYLYIDGDLEWYNTYENDDDSSNFLDSGNTDTIDSGEELPDDDEYEVEVCVDATDAVDESDEGDNCLEVELQDEDQDDEDDNDDENPDYELRDIDVESDDDLVVTIRNNGGDTDSDDKVYIYVYVDGDLEQSLYITNSSSTENFLDEGETSEYNLGDSVIEDLDEDERYDIEVCVDATDNVDEDDEDDNCREERFRGGRLSGLADDDDRDIRCNHSFSDIDGHFAEKAICILYHLGIIDGRSSTRYYPSDGVTRAEFLKLALLSAGYDPYSVSSVTTNDIDSSHWAYEYVTYAAYRGWFNGDSNGNFRPDDSINRAEALVLMMRIFGEENWSYDNSDLTDYWDVDQNDWYAYAVVIADDADIIRGYDNGYFGPSNDLTRAEAAVMLRRAYLSFVERNWYRYND